MKQRSDSALSVKLRFLLLVSSLLWCVAVHARSENDTINLNHTCKPCDMDLGSRSNCESLSMRDGSTRGCDNGFSPLLAIKTNLVEWAGVMPDFRRYTFVPNLELEWFFRDRWSLTGKGSYIRRNYGGGFFGVSSWSLEPRLWLRGSVPQGYIGTYGELGDYDVQNSRMEFGGATGRFWSAGLTFGAVIPFTLRFGLDIGLRGGYRRTTVRDYSHGSGGDYFERRRLDHHWGVTGIEVSLYWRFGTTIKSQRP